MQTSGKFLLNHSQRLRRLRYLALTFFVVLLLPLGAILYFGFHQLEKDLLLDYQQTANKLEQIVDGSLTKRRLISNTLPVEAFDYYRQVYNPYTRQSEQTISPLARIEHEPPRDQWLIGYFQFSNKGHFNSPIWLDSVHDNKLNPELLLRKNTATRIEQIVLQSQSVKQKVRKLDSQEFSEQDALFTVFFDVPDYFIFYRIVTIAEQNWLQGYVVDRNAYLSDLVADILEKLQFDSSVLIELKDEKHTSHVNYYFYESLPDNQVKVSELSKPDPQFQQQFIYQYHHFRPFDGYVLTLTTDALPMTPAMVYSSIFIVILILAILSACYGFYRLGVRQLALGEQRLNFVSSVSHELKTPLTSIRMYSQMLKDGNVLSGEHKKKYFDFIHSESERLARLINNILQLSTLNQQHKKVQPEYVSLNLLVDIIRSKTSSLIEKHGFGQNIIFEKIDHESMLVLVEQDAFAQVVINVTDNAIKFFDSERINDPTRKKIDFTFRQHPRDKHRIQLEIRDYGEGIKAEQESKIFELFYRGGDELTRTTQGTGIGLALVSELISAQHGEIEVQRKVPGLAILIAFKSKLIDATNPK